MESVQVASNVSKVLILWDPTTNTQLILTTTCVVKVTSAIILNLQLSKNVLRVLLCLTKELNYQLIVSNVNLATSVRTLRLKHRLTVLLVCTVSKEL